MEKYFTLQGLTCPNCSAKIELAAGELDGVEQASVNLVRQVLTLRIREEDNRNWSDEVARIVHSYEPEVKVTEQKKPRALPAASDEPGLTKPLFQLLAGGLLFACGLLGIWRFPDTFTGLALLLAAYGVLGLEVLYKAVRNLTQKNFLDENFLMAIATLGAFAIREYPEAVAVMLFYQIGEFFQELAVRRSRRSIAELMDLKAESAVVQRGDAFRTVSPVEVAVGEIIRVNPGEKIPLDGEVVSGASFVNTSALTGEAVLKAVKEKDAVFAGCINHEGQLLVQVTRPLQESAAAKMLELVETAAEKKAPAENFITTFARYYTPAVVGAALLIAILPPLLADADWADWIHRGLIFLVISCPCALVLSVPLTFFGGIGAASKKGVLIKGGNYLEVLSRVRHVAFDKTGTLTRGDFQVIRIQPEPGFTEREVLQAAAFAEAFSHHPIARSILKAWGEPVEESRITDYQETAGKGVGAKVDGKPVSAGNAAFLQAQGISCAPLSGLGTHIHIAEGGQYLGSILIADVLKPDAAAAISRLQQLGIRRCVMLSGDQRSAAVPVARALGMQGCQSALLPEDKVAWIERMKQQAKAGEKVLFVGDGMNDAPVLACADVGAAMGQLGSDAAAMAADVVLMTDEPSALAEAILIARKTRRIVLQNMVLALSLKLLVLLLGALGLVGMWEAVFADVGVMLLAVANALRILKM